jgi:hypothetical protein
VSYNTTVDGIITPTTVTGINSSPYTFTVSPSTSSLYTPTVYTYAVASVAEDVGMYFSSASILLLEFL